ncbi:MAG: hypothetical protein EOP53_01720 [Sphingobacteriales bacterium]|nr:MAG: hypothetical protein EOP53_01720 [Sphingobacteriales bacterium]
MRYRFLVYFLFLFTLVATSCKTDFEVNEKWKEIDIVYSLLDVNDSVHYVKIGKAFLNQDESAYKIAATQDSLYHKDSLDVRLQEIKNGAVQKDIILQKTYLNNKDSGVFASPGQFLYKLPNDYKLNPDLTYKVMVKNTSSGVEASGRTEVVGNIRQLNPNTSQTIGFARDQVRQVSFSSGKGARFYELTIFIHYTEYDASNNNKLKDEVIRWPIFTNYVTPNTLGNAEVRYTIRANDFFKILADNIKPNDKVYRKLGLLDFDITGGGEEIYNYMNVYRPSIGVVQKKPEYTNIENGQGVFSSRNRTITQVPASSTTIKAIMESGTNTSQLNFRQ